ncbi:hypothetical protein BOTBODRAFT_588052 [Botryobasidium botryosum FD-172 SS1]|uniref:Uncharacterized protein n=1 Tax=Botryobasidium botryosum (strain FD-172 SS1) TaxID=930990 RepID=A0A067LX05_BOTB1|nr:hypothetical protein BOTBODRAFT_588052 [Botryobasidium botryosum FD-172 SS1]
MPRARSPSVWRGEELFQAHGWDKRTRAPRKSEEPFSDDPLQLRGLLKDSLTDTPSSGKYRHTSSLSPVSEREPLPKRGRRDQPYRYHQRLPPRVHSVRKVAHRKPEKAKQDAYGALNHLAHEATPTPQVRRPLPSTQPTGKATAVLCASQRARSNVSRYPHETERTPVRVGSRLMPIYVSSVSPKQERPTPSLSSTPRRGTPRASTSATAFHPYTPSPIRVSSHAWSTSFQQRAGRSVPAPAVVRNNLKQVRKAPAAAGPATGLKTPPPSSFPPPRGSSYAPSVSLAHSHSSLLLPTPPVSEMSQLNAQAASVSPARASPSPGSSSSPPATTSSARTSPARTATPFSSSTPPSSRSPIPPRYYTRSVSRSLRAAGSEPGPSRIAGMAGTADSAEESASSSAGKRRRVTATRARSLYSSSSDDVPLVSHSRARRRTREQSLVPSDSSDVPLASLIPSHARPAAREPDRSNDDEDQDGAAFAPLGDPPFPVTNKDPSLNHRFPPEWAKKGFGKPLSTMVFSTLEREDLSHELDVRFGKRIKEEARRLKKEAQREKQEGKKKQKGRGKGKKRKRE